ncbi:hypothetical protein BGZ83_000442 [Gryganskiella cystojenkinii]|nr:hypothetical protein BGZ83_000442 [Gryganskiella cystojenkinii]
MENDLHPSNPPPTRDGKNPNVMIVGAGLAGLLLGILLERAGIPYQIYERSAEVKPLGSIISLSVNILPVFEQLGLYEELKAISLPGNSFEILDGKNLKRIALFKNPDPEATVGYRNQNIARSKLHALMLAKIPAEKIHFSKKILHIIQDKEGATIRCADGTTYHGEILVGADGAYSAVRQSLYKELTNKRALPPNDALDLNKGYACLVGTTSPLDPVKYPAVAKHDSGGALVIGEKNSYCWGLFCVGDNRMCWTVISQIATKADLDDMKFRNSEWGPETHPSMIDEVKDFKTPIGENLGNLISSTPSENISRVFLEDKMFETWTHNRTVLIGDAAHKMLPSSGQGAVNAMQDAVVLANCLYDIGTTSVPDIQEALKSFVDQRRPHVKTQYAASKASAKFQYGHTLLERFIRYAVFNLIPKSIMNDMLTKEAAYRPQATFLPLAPKRGNCHVEPQFPNKRYEEEQKAKEQASGTRTEATVV